VVDLIIIFLFTFKSVAGKLLEESHCFTSIVTLTYYAVVFRWYISAWHHQVCAVMS